MVARGDWQAIVVCADPTAISFHLSARYALIGGKHREQIARNWLGSSADAKVQRLWPYDHED